MRILVIGNPRTKEHVRLVEAGRRLGHPVTVASMHDVTFTFGREPGAMLGNRRVERSFGAICFRGLFPYISEALLLAEMCAEAGMHVMDRRLARRDYVNSKAYETWKLRSVGVPTLRGFHPLSYAEAERRLATATYPLVAKGVHGKHGMHVHRCGSFTAARRLVREHDEGFFMFQPLLDVREEFRALVLDGRFVGAMRKRDIPGDFRRNVALGGSGEAARLPLDLRRMCVASARALGHDLAGIDLAMDARRGPIVLEANRSPGFVGFEAATGIDVAELLVRHLAQGTKKRRR